MGTIFRPVTSDTLTFDLPSLPLSWMWYGYLAPVQITLLTSQWKAGKSTLLAGLLRAMGTGTPFLGREVKPGRALVVTGESRSQWSTRLRTIPVDPQTAELLVQPFSVRKPSLEQWLHLVDYAATRVMAKEIQLVVVDPLMAFIPSLRHGDEEKFSNFVDPLQRLTVAGAAVLLLHRPQKAQFLPAVWTRGEDALLGIADIHLDLKKFGPNRSDFKRRRIIGRSKRIETPERLTYRWNPNNGRFRVIDDPSAERCESFWPLAFDTLKDSPDSLTVEMIRNRWSRRFDPPSRRQLDECLRRAMFLNQILREGKGVKSDPYRYRLNAGVEAYWRDGAKVAGREP